MAPGFFSKLVKPSPGYDGRRSFESPSSPSPSRLGVNTSQNTTQRSRSPTPDSLNINPSFTVIPPSPRTDVGQLSSSQSSTNSEARSRGERRAQSVSAGSSSPPVEDEVTTPVPGRSMRPDASPKSAVPRALTPSSSTGNLRQRVQPHTPPASEQYVHRQPSNKSIRSKTVPPPLDFGHPRAATEPNNNGEILNSAAPLVESPTNFRTSTDQSVGSPDPRANLSLSADLLRPRADSDAVSIASATSAGKRKPWRRASLNNKRKPTGLASAIAASGLAMANPSMTVPQFSPAAMSSNGSVSGRVNTQRKSSNPTSHKTSGSASSISRPIRSARGSLDLSESTPQPRRRRPASLSISNHSQSSFHSEDNSVDGDSGSEDELDLDAITDDIPVTGFAVASNKRNADFHEMFRNIPEGDYLIEDYGCALQRDILVQGRLYISENHICFHANIFGWVTDLQIPFYDITSLEKKMTAFVIPNAIQITTRQAKYTFASFLSRDTTFDVIFNIWRLACPEDASSIGSVRGSLDIGRPPVIEEGAGTPVVDATAGVPPPGSGPQRKATQCACGLEGKHYTEIAMDSIFPGTPDKIHNLMFASGFIKDFLRVDQKLIDTQISDWTPITPGSKLLARNMSYIKPLTASLGPRQTKCELRDETVHCDFDDYVATITTTRTPEVPSGGVFSVKTRTCIMWAGPSSTKVLVTTQVEWTGRSFIKGIIERSAIDGQKVYHADLDKAMRVYIQEHQSEFLPAGLDPATVIAEVASPASEQALPSPLLTSHLLDEKTREHERNQRGLQWAYDTFEGASQVARRSTAGALELIKDAWDQSTSATILIFIIVGLVISNIWTLTMVGRREEVGRRKEMRKTEEREKWVQGIVTALWDELAEGKRVSTLAAANAPIDADWRSEVGSIAKTLDAVEERVRRIRESLNSLD